MSKKAYVGVNGQSHNVKQIYVGVGGVPKKVLKGYVGVNGVPKVFWESAPPIIHSWDYWTSVSGTISDLGVSKTNNAIAYYAAIKTSNGDKALLISPASSAVAYDGYTSQGTVSGWYYNAQGTISGYSSDCLLSNTEYSNVTDAVDDLINRIYALNFQNDFQIGTNYTTDILIENMVAIRKAIGIFLFENISWYNAPNKTPYTLLSDNVDTVLQQLISSTTLKAIYVVYITTSYYNNKLSYIYINVSKSNSTNPHVSYRVTSSKLNNLGYDYYDAEFSGFTVSGSRKRASITESGIEYSTSSSISLSTITVGCKVNTIPEGTSYPLQYSNVGIDL